MTNDTKFDKTSRDVRLDLLRLVESGEDYDAAVNLSIACAKSPDRWLRINALHCFGYIARVYGRLDLEAALPWIKDALGDTNDTEIAAAAQDALDDLEVFLPGFKMPH